MKKFLVVLAAVAMAMGVYAQKPGDVVILFDNDAHCAIDGYPVMAGLRDSLQKKGCAVAVVSAGDFSFGGPVGAASKGEFVIRLMNAVGYDAAALGNHEFDYGMMQLRHLEHMLNAPMLTCNLKENKNAAAMPFAPFVIRSYYGVNVAFVGVTTPTALYTSSPMSFKDAEGNYIYNLSNANLAAIVQRAVDNARAAGADVVVLLSHLGDSDGVPTSVQVASQINGVDVILDAHDHHVIPSRRISDKDGNKLCLTSGGTQFQNIGMAILPTSTEEVINKDNIRTRLVPVDSLRRVGCINKAVSDSLKVIKDLFDAMGSRVVATTDVDLIAEEGDIRVVRLRETNLGDLIADAFRMVKNTDIGWANGGGIRANVTKGPVTHNQLYAVCPYNNQIKVIRVTGQDLLNALETAVREYPKAEGCFAQVSGISFTIDTTIPSSVVLDKNGRFENVAGPYRVSNVRVGMKPLELEDSYTIAGAAYVLLNGGDAISFPSKVELDTEMVSDLELVERYIQENLGGKVGTQYSATQGRINFK